MKKITAAVICLTAFAAQPAWAHEHQHAHAFNGVAATLHLGATSANTVYTDNVGINREHLGAMNPISQIDLAFFAHIKHHWLMGIGVTRDFNNLAIGLNETRNPTDYKMAIKAQNHYGAYVQPTYKIDDATAIFGTIGLHTTQIKLSDTNGQIISLSNNAYYTDTVRTMGISYGLGFKRFIYKDVFLQLDAQFLQFQKKSINIHPWGVYAIELNTMTNTLGIGYQF